VAASLRQDRAPAPDGTGHLDARGPEGLDPADEPTIEAFPKVDAFGTPQGPVSKGAPVTGTDDAVPYACPLTADGSRHQPSRPATAGPDPSGPSAPGPGQPGGAASPHTGADM